MPTNLGRSRDWSLMDSLCLLTWGSRGIDASHSNANFLRIALIFAKIPKTTESSVAILSLMMSHSKSFVLVTDNLVDDSVAQKLHLIQGMFT